MREQLDLLQQMPIWDWPEEAAVWIREALESQDHQVREDAAQLAPGVMDDAMAGLLLGLVQQDPAENVAAAAAIALGPALEECSMEYDQGLADAAAELEDEITLSRRLYDRVRETLEAVYRDGDRPPVVRRRALEAAVRAPQRWQADAARAAYQSDDSAWRQTGVFCMGFLDGFEETILEALQTDDPELLREAILAAGNQEIEAAGEQIMRVAGDEDEELDLRIAAIAALETLDPPNSLDLLEELAEHDDEEIAQAAANSLEEREVFAGLEDDEEGDYGDYGEADGDEDREDEDYEDVDPGEDPDEDPDEDGGDGRRP